MAEFVRPFSWQGARRSANQTVTTPKEDWGVRCPQSDKQLKTFDYVITNKKG